MPIYKLEDLRYPQLDGLQRDRTLFTLVVSPIEEHGPHLPLGVDAFNAEFFASEISEMFLRKYTYWNIVRMPSFYAGCFIFDAPGSMKTEPRIIRKLVSDHLSSLAKYGFRYFLIFNAHGGPTHVVALEEAARSITSGFRNVKALSFSGHLIWNFLRGGYLQELCTRLNLTEQEAKMLAEDSHAGQWETSMMLKLKPELVDPEFKNLPSFTAPLISRVRPNYPMKAGNQLGYVGHPALANEKFAEQTSAFLLEKAFELIDKSLFSERAIPASFFYRLPFFRTAFLEILITIAILSGLVWWILKH